MAYNYAGGIAPQIAYTLYSLPFDGYPRSYPQDLSTQNEILFIRKSNAAFAYADTQQRDNYNPSYQGYTFPVPISWVDRRSDSLAAQALDLHIFNLELRKLSSIVPSSAASDTTHIAGSISIGTVPHDSQNPYVATDGVQSLLVMDYGDTWADVYDQYKDYYCLWGIQAYDAAAQTPRSLAGQNTINNTNIGLYECAAYSGKIQQRVGTLARPWEYINNLAISGYMYYNIIDFAISTNQGRSIQGYYNLKYWTGDKYPIICFTHLTSFDGTLTNIQYVCAIAGHDEDEAINNVRGVVSQANMPIFVNDPEGAKTVGDVGDIPGYTPPGVPGNKTPNPNDPTEPEGNNKDDPIDEPSDEEKTPEVTPVDAAANLWALDSSECGLVANFMWTPHLSVVGALTEITRDITNAWVYGYYYPFDIVAHSAVGTTLDTIKIAGLDTGISAFRVTSKYNKFFDFGTIGVPEYYHSFLDYAPYTSVYMYLPYIGFKTIPAAQIVNKYINLQYSVDFVTGICTAFVYANGSLINMYSGRMGIPIAISGLNDITSFAKTVDAALTTASAAIPAALSGSGTGAAIGSAVGPVGAAIGGVIGGIGAGVGSAIGTQFLRGQTHGDVATLGSAGGETWITAPQSAFVVVQRANYSEARNKSTVDGYPSQYGGTVSDFTGFLKCSSVQGNGLPCTDTEKQMIIDILRQGVYI